MVSGLGVYVLGFSPEDLNQKLQFLLFFLGQHAMKSSGKAPGRRVKFLLSYKVQQPSHARCHVV